jgi:hypothetical protein
MNTEPIPYADLSPDLQLHWYESEWNSLTHPAQHALLAILTNTKPAVREEILRNAHADA